MSRVADAASEERDAKRREKLIEALSFGIHDALEYYGAELRGLSIKYDEFNILVTVRAERGGIGAVCFVGSDTMVNALVKLYAEASRDALVWKPDRYQGSGH